MNARIAGRLLRAAVRDTLALVGRPGDIRPNRCVLCGEKRRDITAHLYIDHADGN